jgi:hypothetical protein
LIRFWLHTGAIYVLWDGKEAAPSHEFAEIMLMDFSFFIYILDTSNLFLKLTVSGMLIVLAAMARTGSRALSNPELNV